MVGRVSRYFFHALAGSRQLQRLASRVGLRKPTSFARRFIAGETLEEVVQVSRAVQRNGLLLTLDHLGENITNLGEAEVSTRHYLEIVDTMIREGIDRNISL